MQHDFYSYLLWHMRHAESLAHELCKDDIDEENYRTLITDFKSFEKNLEKLVLETHGEGGCYCPICGAKFPVYLPSEKSVLPNFLCPNCWSATRHRALALILKFNNLPKSGMKVLHFAPETAFYEIFSSVKDIEYWPVDLDPERYEGKVKKAVDIKDIPFNDDYFDLVMCTHVLEHIPDDKKAMSELHRVLKPNIGIALLTVPVFNISETLENPEYDTPELRLKYFGQEDHVRKYGLDYPNKLRTAGFFVEEITPKTMFNEFDLRKYGLRPNEKFHLCKKLIE